VQCRTPRHVRCVVGGGTEGLAGPSVARWKTWRRCEARRQGRDCGPRDFGSATAAGVTTTASRHWLCSHQHHPPSIEVGGMTLNTALWVLAGVGAAGFLFSGGFKLAQPHEKYVAAQPWAKDVPRWAPNALGAVEVLGAVGLILPAAVDVAPILVPIAATGLGLVMVGAVVLHLRRREFSALPPSVVLLAVSATVAWGRFGPHSF
jgi:hypothetical protein